MDTAHPHVALGRNDTGEAKRADFSREIRPVDGERGLPTNVRNSTLPIAMWMATFGMGRYQG